MYRRGFIASLAAVSAARSQLFASAAKIPRLGICTFSCHLHWQAVRNKQPGTAFHDAASFYEYARLLGAEGIQASVRDLDAEAIKAMRVKIESEGGYYEGDIRLPRTKADLDDFEREVRWTRAAGATVARAVLMGGRRYETFRGMQEFLDFQALAKERLGLVEPILRKHQLKLAVENHKDLTLDEQLTLIRGIGSEWIGVLVDTGNNIALLDEPNRVIQELAPLALSVHLKDMAVQPHADGFLLSEVPCGTGFLDLRRILDCLSQSNPSIVFNLEMATRDPLKIPCLTDGYWLTFPDRKATHLDAAMQLVGQHPLQQPPPSIAGKSLARQLGDEEANNRESLRHVRLQVT